MICTYSAGKSKAPYPAVLLALGHSDNGILNPRYAALFASLGTRGWLVGWNFARFRIWDSIRAVDYLATRPDIDLTRLGVTGTSGGEAFAQGAFAAEILRLAKEKGFTPRSKRAGPCHSPQALRSQIPSIWFDASLSIARVRF